MRRVVALDGPGWAVREALGETWRWYIDARDVPARNNADEAARAAHAAPGWWPATVPGSVIIDLWRAGELADPYHGRNSRAAEWTGTRSWVYRRVVVVPDRGADETVVLELDGVDPEGLVVWDGRELGRTGGLYHRSRFVIPEELAAQGWHRLAIVVAPVPASVPQVGRTELVRAHRPRMNEGWDFCPRLPHQGIWRPARVVVGSVHLVAATVSAELDHADDGQVCALATFAATVEASADLVVLDEVGATVARARGRVLPGGGEVRLIATVSQPRRWWPHGLGAPTTYTATLRLDGAPDPLWTGTIGFRRAELRPNRGAPPGALPYTAIVDGQPLPLIGWNWAPVDAQYGAVGVERVRHLVELAARSGARVLRVWGGGLLETDEFYDACDRAGIFVWQEFSQSSSGIQSAPATDAEFVALMRAEAAVVVPERAHHPSLLVWGGGNELDLDGVPLDEDRSPVLAALREEVGRLDPGRAWLPTSPSGPVFANRLDTIERAPGDLHDVHGPWEHQGLREQYALANAGTALAHSEFGVEGMANRRLLEHLVPAPQRWPADRGNPVYRHLGEWWNNATFVQDCFGGRPQDIDTLRRASQFLQATGLAYAVEADRRRWPRCSMVLPWQLAESYPNAWCTAVIDHLGDVKPAYHAVARAFAPDRVTIEVPTLAWGAADQLEAAVWLWSETGIPAGSTVVARLRAADGEVRHERRWAIEEPVRDPVRVGAVAPMTPGRHAVVIWDVTWTGPGDTTIDRELVVATTAEDLVPLLDLAPATLDVAVHLAGGKATVHVVHGSGPAAVGLQLLDARPPEATGWAICDGDPRPLLPGQTRDYTVRWRDAIGPRRLALEGLNTGTTTIDLSEDGW